MGKIEIAQLKDDLSLEMDKNFLESFSQVHPEGRVFEDMVIDVMEEIMACGIYAAEAVYQAINRFPGQTDEVQDVIADQFKYISLYDIYNG